nr:DUF2933 domain-containing protein [Diaphorobacter aerolatus]
MLVLGIVAGYFLWTEHRAHLQQWWPYALLLACPLMHVFMHKGMADMATNPLGPTRAGGRIPTGTDHGPRGVGLMPASL